MCQTCGCAIEGGPGAAFGEAAGRPVTVDVVRGILAENDHRAAHNRDHFDAAKVLVINLMSSPGAGKTSLLEATIEAGRARGDAGLRIAVIEGDLETDNDARRIRDHGVPAVQITTGGACHLDATMIHNAIAGLDLDALDVLFIENVGNLVCPASFDLGHHQAVALLSTTEGDDKPAKYPVLFRSADLVLISKADLLAHLDDFDPAFAEAAVRGLANEAPVVAVSARDGSGLQRWLDWLGARVVENRRRLATEPVARPSQFGRPAPIHDSHRPVLRRKPHPVPEL
ncbi:MAG TPA: hydrogenase nickel incorporation protein HypB [Rhodospirillales bacterium]|nr:hydrogenase nickel incorporation protein HypB [Rhodospirillales bacterium]